MSDKVVLLTGGTSGIGLATVRALAEKGARVYELSRRETADIPARHIPCDVSDEAAVRAAVETVLREAGRIDAAVCNAGFGISGAAEFTENADAKGLLDVNLFGGVNVAKAVIPHMREAGGGRIVFISSVAAPVAIPFQAWYSVSKAAINAYALALANELRPFGITVAAVMPGDIRTGFTGARRKSELGDDVYGGRIRRSVAVMERDELSGMDPAVAGRFVARVALKKGGKPLYAIGLQYKLVVLLIKLLPAGLANRIVGLLYAK